MYQREADLTKDVKRYLQTVPNLFFFKASDRFLKGISDILVCYKGAFVAIELKAKSKPTIHQEIFIAKVKQAGGYGAICHNVEEVKNLLSEVDM